MRENLGFSGAVHSGAGHTSGVGKCMGSVSMNFNRELAIQGRGEGGINGKTNLPKKVTGFSRCHECHGICGDSGTNN